MDENTVVNLHIECARSYSTLMLHRSQCLLWPSFWARSWNWRRSRGTRWGFICASPATEFRPRSANVFISTFIVSNSDYRSNRWTGYRVPRFLYAKRLEKCNNIFQFRFTVPPVIHVPNQLVGAPLGTDVVLECFVEASPMSINYWVKDPKGEITFAKKKYFRTACLLFRYRVLSHHDILT